jgi:hypothetical protein
MVETVRAIIEAAVKQAKAENSLLWTEELAARIAASTPLPIEPAQIAAALAKEAARLGVAVSVPAAAKCDGALCDAG